MSEVDFRNKKLSELTVIEAVTGVVCLGLMLCIGVPIITLMLSVVVIVSPFTFAKLAWEKLRGR